MKIGEICNRSVVVIDKNESALEAARLMREHNVGDVVIVEESAVGKVPVGIITDRDLAIEIVAEEVDPDSVIVADLFIRPKLITASVNDDLAFLLEKMHRYGIRRVPVVERNGSLAGIITADDILGEIAHDFSEVVRLLEKQTVK